MRARRGGEELRCGKVEALFLEEPYRGRRAGEEPVVLRLRSALYALAEERRIELLHAYVLPTVGRVLGLEPLRVGERTLVAVVRPGRVEPRAPSAVLALAQGLARAPMRAPVRLRAPCADDVELVSASPPAPARWTVLAGDAWDWYRASPLLRVLELGGRNGSRALVQLPGSPGDALRLAGWRPERPGLRPALLLVAEAARLAREHGAGTLRFQPWPAEPCDGALRRACRMLGLVARDDFTTLSVRARDPELTRADAVAATPLLYLAF